MKVPFRRPELSYANVAATIALVAALAGGTAYGLAGKNSVDSGDIRKGQVKASDLKQPKFVRVKDNPHESDSDTVGGDPCENGRTGMLCGSDSISGLRGWFAVGGYARPAFARDGFGLVRIIGTVTQGPPGTQTIFVLPKKYRPAKAHEFAVAREQAGNTCTGDICDEDIAVVRVSPNGQVTFVREYPSEGVGLDGIAFPAR